MMRSRPDQGRSIETETTYIGQRFRPNTRNRYNRTPPSTREVKMTKGFQETDSTNMDKIKIVIWKLANNVVAIDAKLIKMSSDNLHV